MGVSVKLRDNHALGWLSIQHLANRINDFVSDYHGRRITGALLEEANQAAKRQSCWRRPLESAHMPT
ncbi:hypothetical protein [Pseudomonas monsensis]